jgi:alpha-galactosidase
MRLFRTHSFCAFLLAATALPAFALTTMVNREQDDAHLWVKQHLETPAEPLFHFVYGSEDSGPFLSQCRAEASARVMDADRTEHTLTWTDAKSGLVTRCVGIAYHDFPAMEWTVWFKNTGPADTAILKDVQPLDHIVGGQTDKSPFRLLHARGSHQEPQDFAPQETVLDKTVSFAPDGGRSSDGVMPFFNLSRPGSDGVILGVGWTGQWAATFEPKPEGMHIRAGMERTQLLLHPGEEIRTPAMLLLFWRGGDSLRGNNLLRALLLKHYSPRPGGKTVEPPIAVSPHGVIPFEGSTEANMVEGIKNIAAHKFPVDTWWIDAGWNGEQKEWARAVGTWSANPVRYPNGLKPVGDAAHANGLRFLVWFEPERVMPDTWLYNNHPEWLLKPANTPMPWRYQENDKFHMLNLGNPEALAWLKAEYSRIIGEAGIDIYRQDANLSPLWYWRNGEAEDRQGMNEIRHIMGLYDFYDTLMRDHPGLLIDNCASGGRRIDFEMMRRALTLTRSDHIWDPVADQAMNPALSLWMPYVGIGAVVPDAYLLRSGMGPHISLPFDWYHEGEMWQKAAAMVEQVKSVRHLFTADFYPLTPNCLDKDRWMAWQYHDEARSEGLVLAFRRDDCANDTLQVMPRGLDPDKTYTLTDWDNAPAREITGKEIMAGFDVTIPAKPGAAVIHYKAK